MPTAPPPTRDAAVEARFFWEKFKVQIAAVVILALLAIVGFGGYMLYSQRRDAAASAALADAKTAPDLQGVIEHYGNTRAAANAYLLLADAQRNEKKFAEANATLQVFTDKYPKHELVTTARIAMAANLESMGKPDEALALYQRTAASYPNSFNAPLALLSQVHLLRAKNKVEEARMVCEKILTDYRDSYWASEAARQLRTLKPPPSMTKPAPAATAPPLLAPPSPVSAPPTAGAPAAPPAPPPPKTEKPR
jgi:predicted negative regulator of RcsB-dependent stress response